MAIPSAGSNLARKTGMPIRPLCCCRVDGVPGLPFMEYVERMVLVKWGFFSSLLDELVHRAAVDRFFSAVTPARAGCRADKQRPKKNITRIRQAT